LSIDKNSSVKFLRIDDNEDNSQSLEIEVKHDEELVNCYDSHLFQSFDIFNEEQLSEGHQPLKNESEILNRNNNIFDSANIYLNLSNKVSYNKDDTNRLKVGGKLESYNHSLNYQRQTTAKSGNQTDSNQKKALKQLRSDFDNDHTMNTNMRMKSFTTRRLNFYSDFDHETDRVSNATELRPSLGSGAKPKELRPNVIKGFCSSISSSKSEIEKPVTQEPQIDLKHHFYNSGTAFYQSERDGFTSPVKSRNHEIYEKSHKKIELQYRLSVDSDGGRVNKTLGAL
jgi:hypothetical protein